MARELCGTCHGLGCGVCFDGFVEVPETGDPDGGGGGSFVHHQLTPEERDKTLGVPRPSGTICGIPVEFTN